MKKQRILLVGIISVGAYSPAYSFRMAFLGNLCTGSVWEILMHVIVRPCWLIREHRYADARKELAPLARLDTAKCAQFPAGRPAVPG